MIPLLRLTPCRSVFYSSYTARQTLLLLRTSPPAPPQASVHGGAQADSARRKNKSSVFRVSYGLISLVVLCRYSVIANERKQSPFETKHTQTFVTLANCVMQRLQKKNHGYWPRVAT